MKIGFNYRGGDMTRITSCGIGFGLLLAAIALPAGAQSEAPAGSQSASSGQSLGEYARRVRKPGETSSKPKVFDNDNLPKTCLLYTSPSPRDMRRSRMPSSA